VEQLAASFLARFRAGERPSLTEITAAHPELADEIRGISDTHVLRILPTISAIGTIDQRIRSRGREAA